MPRNSLSNSPCPLGRARGRGRYILLARAINNKPFQCSNGRDSPQRRRTAARAEQGDLFKFYARSRSVISAQFWYLFKFYASELWPRFQTVAIMIPCRGAGPGRQHHDASDCGVTVDMIAPTRVSLAGYFFTKPATWQFSVLGILARCRPASAATVTGSVPARDHQQHNSVVAVIESSRSLISRPGCQ